MSAPRDGLAGSDEAVEAQRAVRDAAARVVLAGPGEWIGDGTQLLELVTTMVAAVEPFIAARVRAEADEHYARADSADLTDAYREMDELSAQLSTVCAEVVAEERQRIAVGIRELPLVFEHDGALLSKSPEQVRSDAVAFAAGSVPVATPPRPEIVTLCGSTRFKAEFEAEYRRLSLAGNIVLTVSMFGHSGDLTPEQCKDGHPMKTALDELHKRRIDLADSVRVINPGGYIGTSTCSEIDYATTHGKPITYLEDGPVATPAEPVKCWCLGNPTVSHRRGIDGCRYAPGGDFATNSDAPESAAAPSVGTGTPAEEVSGGSEHAGRQEPAELTVLRREIRHSLLKDVSVQTVDRWLNDFARLSAATEVARYRATMGEMHAIMDAAIVRGGYRPGESERVEALLAAALRDGA